MTNKLSYRFEGNLVRPYTFSHLTPMQVYGHRNAPLAHPYGSNFAEVLTEFNWSNNINPKLRLRFFASFGIRGLDTDSLNYGSDIYESYINRANDLGNYIGQGTKQSFLSQIQEPLIQYFAKAEYMLLQSFKHSTSQWMVLKN